MTNNSSSPGIWETTDWSESGQCPPSVCGATFLIVAYSTVIAVGLLGNVGLVFIIGRQKELRNVTNILIANLSCSDILMCVVCLPVTVIYTLMDRWVLGEALCKVRTQFLHLYVCWITVPSLFVSVICLFFSSRSLSSPSYLFSSLSGHSVCTVCVSDGVYILPGVDCVGAPSVDPAPYWLVPSSRPLLPGRRSHLVGRLLNIPPLPILQHSD